ncbi:MAG: hypothetical protein NTW52_16880 [Planctomycetota bacterium]|nr:hypothetical protein [Planctomycetota bacterium]
MVFAMNRKDWHSNITLYKSLWLFVIVLTAQVHAVDVIRLPETSGPYTVEQWKKDWPRCEFEDGIKEGRVEVIRADEKSWLRVNYAKGEIGPDKNGADWRWPFGDRESAQLKYTMRFSTDFDFVKGGKLPGLSGGPENISGGKPADGKNGFSARLMWRRDGRGEAYVYHAQQSSNYGDSFPFPSDFRFPKGQPIEVRILVKMNNPNRKDGLLRVWIGMPGKAEFLVVDKPEMQWRTTDQFGVDSIYFDTFYGGGDKSWAPTNSGFAEFTNIEVSLIDH